MTDVRTDFDSLDALYRRLESESVIRAPEQVRATFGPVATRVPAAATLTLRTYHLAAVGRLLVSLDDAAAHAVAAIGEWAGAGDGAVMKPIWAGRTFEVREARRGSLVVVLDALDMVAALLLADPVQLVLTMHWFWERAAAFASDKASRPCSHDDYVAMGRDLAAVAAAAARAGAAVHLDWEVTPDGGVRLSLDTVPPPAKS